jgi:lysozyme family protein
MADFNQAIIKTLKWEGGETTDTGGYTKYGISQKAYPNLDIKNLTIQDAKKIYKSDYWDRLKGDQIINQNLASVLFDYAVNAGTGQAAKDLQRIVNNLGTNISIDGSVGPQTLAAINKLNGDSLANSLSARRIDFYKNLASKNPALYAKFLNGWLKRASDFVLDMPAQNIGAFSLMAAGLVAWLFIRSRG